MKSKEKTKPSEISTNYRRLPGIPIDQYLSDRPVPNCTLPIYNTLGTHNQKE